MAAILFLSAGLCGCAEINIYVQDHSTATVTIEQDRTNVKADADIPLGTALQ
jgi:hypothetical protein